MTTGSTEQVKQKNLYDIAGNLWEWTQETSYSHEWNYNNNVSLNSYLVRGGSFGNSYTTNPPCYRYRDNCSATFPSRGFRAMLYIK